MNKIPDNSSADRLSRLLSRNLGTDFDEIRGNKNNAKTGQTEKTVKGTANQTSSSSTNASQAAIKHGQLSGQIGLVNPNSYQKGTPNINQRAQRRKQLEEARKQANIESIMSLAMEYCSSDTSGEEIDPDWFHQFIQLSEDSSSKLMQALWGKILAGEISNPGTFSFKSLTILKRMTNKEAVAFQQACQLAMTNRKDNSNQIIFGCYQKPGLLDFFALSKKHTVNLSKLNLTYPALLMLMDTELIYHSEIESGELSKGETLEYSYHGQKIRFIAKKNGTALNYFKFTQTGYELAKLIRLAPAQEYLSELSEVFAKSFELEY